MPSTRVIVNSREESIEARGWRCELAAGHAGKQAAVGQLEQQATLLRSIQHLVVPGLLQTRPYALALFQRAHPAGRDAEQAADARLARQWILDDQTRRFEWVITEAALWWRPADWAVQAEQLRAVATAATRPNVDLRILPLDVQAPTFYHSFTLLDDLVAADSIGEILLSDPDDIARQIEVFTLMQQAALDPQASRAVLDGLAARFAPDDRHQGRHQRWAAPPARVRGRRGPVRRFQRGSGCVGELVHPLVGQAEHVGDDALGQPGCGQPPDDLNQIASRLAVSAAASTSVSSPISAVTSSSPARWCQRISNSSGSASVSLAIKSRTSTSRSPNRSTSVAAVIPAISATHSSSSRGVRQGR